MNKRTIIISIIAGLLAIGGGIVFYIQQTLTFAPLPTYNTSIMSGKPDGASCINKSRSTGIAIELIDLGADKVYLAGGSNPMTLEEWNNTTVRFPLMKNSERHILFDDTCLYRSPGIPEDCQGDDCAMFVEHYGHTWLVLSNVAGQGCFPDRNGCNSDVVAPGYVSITTIDKCQEMTFLGPTIYELVDNRGNRYVMHATDDGSPNVDGIHLPEGWSLAEVTISEPLILRPRGEGHCYYNIVRDSTLQSYHQYFFVDEVFPSDGK